MNLSATFSPSSSPCLSINSVARTKGGTMASWPRKMRRWIGMPQDEAPTWGTINSPKRDKQKTSKFIRDFFDLFIRDCRFSLHKTYAKPRGLHWHCILRVNVGGCLKLAVALLKDVPRLFFGTCLQAPFRPRRNRPSHGANDSAT